MEHKPEADTGLKSACLRAVRETIAERGLEQLSLREVARRLGVSHQAPYRHFPSRDHLLAEVILECFQDFARFLDDRQKQEGPEQDLNCLGTRYLQFALERPLEYRLMFNTPWPEPAEEVGLVGDALHAFNILRDDLRGIHGRDAEAQRQVDQDAMLIWSAMHGLSSILQSSAMAHLDLAEGVREQVPAYIMERVRGMLQTKA
jgi:AcrR family transcriptional regulator